MNKEIIKSYIEYAIENGLTTDGLPVREVYWVTYNYAGIKYTSLDGYRNMEINLFELITSKEFIEAIALGIIIKKRGVIDFTQGDGEILLDREMDSITIEQAISIRDNELADFIINLGIGTITKK